MVELVTLIVLLVAGLVAIATAVSLVRVVIGAEILTLAALYAAAVARDVNLLAVAAAVGVAETLIFVATLFKLAKEGHV